MEGNGKFELIVCIVNAGFSQNVMAAARKAGARGGSILRGRGSANPESEEFFNITIQPDKEVILILASEDSKDGILIGVISYVLCHVVAGKFKEISITMWILAALFICKYIFI